MIFIKLKRFKKDHFSIIFLFILCLPIIWPFLKSGFFPIHDNQHVVRLYEMDQALKEGQFPVRWVKNLGFGYGYPLFNFYPPILYYFAQSINFLGFSYLNSIKLIFVLSFFSSAFFMYLFTKDFFKPKAAFLASLLYLYLPYRAVDCYVRGALAELLSLSWLPALLWEGGRILYLKKVKFKDIFLASFFLFLLITTHNLTMMMFAPFFIFWSLLFLIKLKKQERLKRLFLFILAVLLGAGLSCFFWLPALAEKKYTLVDQILLKRLYDYRFHFLYPDQLWHSTFGFGGSIPGRDDGMSFEIGKAHLIIGLLAIVLVGLKWLKDEQEKRDYPIYGAFLLFFGSSISVAFTCSPYLGLV